MSPPSFSLIFRLIRPLRLFLRLLSSCDSPCHFVSSPVLSHPAPLEATCLANIRRMSVKRFQRPSIFRRTLRFPGRNASPALRTVNSSLPSSPRTRRVPPFSADPAGVYPQGTPVSALPCGRRPPFSSRPTSSSLSEQLPPRFSHILAHESRTWKHPPARCATFTRNRRAFPARCAAFTHNLRAFPARCATFTRNRRASEWFRERKRAF